MALRDGTQLDEPGRSIEGIRGKQHETDVANVRHRFISALFGADRDPHQGRFEDPIQPLRQKKTSIPITTSNIMAIAPT